ncbi:MAG: hypothetical protein AAFR66_13785, partial [Bacteroidota bacterium]
MMSRIKNLELFLFSIILFFSLTLKPNSCVSQKEVKQELKNLRKELIKEIFWSDADELLYLGMNNRYELGTYSYGIEAKIFSAYYTLFAAYGSYSKLPLNREEG